MSISQANAAAAGTLVNALAGTGLEEAFICPGSRNTPAVLALDAHARIRTHTVLDERAAAFIALGAARISGRAVALCCTSGSAVTHFWPAVVEASESRVPLIVLSADRPPELQQCGAAQAVDQSRLFGNYARWFFDLGVPSPGRPTDFIATVATQAWLHAHGPNAGPVHLNVPFAEPLWDVHDVPAAFAPSCGLLRGRSQLRGDGLARIADRLATTTRGAIVCGAIDPPTADQRDPSEPDLVAALDALARALDWPLIADPVSQLRFRNETCPQLIECADAVLRSASVADALAPDLVLRVGRTPTSRAITGWLERHATQRTILVDPSGRAHDPMHGADTLVAADPALLCQQLVEHVSMRPASNTAHERSSWRGRWCEANELALRALDAHVREGLWEGAAIRELIAALPQQALLHVGSSMPIRDLDSFGGSAHRDLIVLANRGANGIDGTLATGGGEALASGPGHATAVLCGDLAFLHDVGGLAAIAQLPVDLTIVVLCNGGGGIFEYLPIAAHTTAFEKHFLTPQRTQLAGICAAVGAHHRRVDQRDQLAGAFVEGIGSSGINVIEVAIDRKDSVRRHAAAFATVEKALTPWLAAAGINR